MFSVWTRRAPSSPPMVGISNIVKIWSSVAAPISVKNFAAVTFSGSQVNGVACTVLDSRSRAVVQLTALAAEAVDRTLIPGADGDIIADGVGDAGINIHLITGHQAEGDLIVFCQ